MGTCGPNKLLRLSTVAYRVPLFALVYTESIIMSLRQTQDLRTQVIYNEIRIILRHCSSTRGISAPCTKVGHEAHWINHDI
jgi:hypothetical protein